MNDETRARLLELLAPHIKAVHGSWVQHPGGIPGGIGQRVASLELSEDGAFKAKVVTDCVQSIDIYYRIVGKFNQDTLEDVEIKGPFYD